MSQDPAGLDALHDIVAAPPVPWWPPAPVWWIVGASLVVALTAAAALAVARHRRAAYRRAALRELAATSGDDLVATAELLRRAALAAFPREEVVPLTGAAWIGWLEKTGGRPVPSDAARALTEGLYSGDTSGAPALAEFTAFWIRRHRAP